MKTVRNWLQGFADRFGLPKPKAYRTIHRLNRSQRWRRANSYAHAREIARALGKSDRPVR